MIALYEKGYIDLRFADESGFSLKPLIPYGWYPKGQTQKLFPQKDKRFNVFALMNLNNQIITYTSFKSIHSAFVIACIHDFAKQKDPHKETVILLDNAPIHRSKEFLACLPEWEAKGIYFLFLPKYSPHLNAIEIFWKRVKYKWLQLKDYHSLDTLHTAFLHIVKQFGTKFKIIFEHFLVSNNSG